jgi:hypothetical protein
VAGLRALKTAIWPYQVKIMNPDIISIETWLNDNVGFISKDWQVIYHYKFVIYYLKTPEDTVLFKLRWT